MVSTATPGLGYRGMAKLCRTPLLTGAFAGTRRELVGGRETEGRGGGRAWIAEVHREWAKKHRRGSAQAGTMRYMTDGGARGLAQR